MHSFKTIINKLQRLFVQFSIFILFGLISLLLINYHVGSSVDALSYANTDDIPANKVGLLLGTSKLLRSGTENRYYSYRIDAAVRLYKAGKIAHILISGDNSREEYNEPEDMKQDLIDRGIPEDKIHLDYAGFRTLDSVVRAKEIFGQTAMTVISQPFHTKRAIYIARYYKIDAIGFEAKKVRRSYGFRVQVRELFARCKMMLDLYLLGTEPKFYGEQIEIG